MKTKSKSKTLQIITAVYGALYLLGFILPLLIKGPNTGTESVSSAEMVTIPIAFSVFILGAITSFFNEKYGGIILMIWHLLVWSFSLMLWKEAGMILVLILPMMFIAVFLVRNWYKTNSESFNTVPKLSKFTLQLLLVNYSLVYLLIIVTHTLPLVGIVYPTAVDERVLWDYQSFPGIILLLSLVIFLFGFFLSWSRERIAGILFIVWYALILETSFIYGEFGRSGPWFIMGLTVLIQGIIYLTRKNKLKDSLTA